jgi:branched-chain amino acid transport system ATP-binding protein
MLELQGLCAGYGGVPVLRDVDLRIAPGTMCALLGPNGAGKSTLVRTVSGLLRPLAGQVIFDGRNLSGVPVEERARMGLAHVPEGHRVVEELTVEENLRLATLWRRDRDDVHRAVAEVYGLFEPLALRRAQPGHQLSGGERQMLALASALVTRPRLLLLDEPSLGLAPRLTTEIIALLGRLRDSTGLTVLLVEQNVRALSVADRGLVMSLGRIVADADAAELRDDDRLRPAYLGF